MPAAVLFTRVWQDNSDDRQQIDLERKGVEYITAFTSLIGAIAEAQSSALQDVADPPDTLTAAVSDVSAVDARLGGDLGTTQRWTGLQDKLGKLSKVTGNKLAVYQAHVEVSDLALALLAEVRRNSGLVNDPQADISNLQQAVAIDMPVTMVEVSRMGDLAPLVSTAPAAQRQTVAAEFGLSVLRVQDAVNTLTDSLQNAVDDTTSPTLSGNLVSALDSFRRGVESMTRGANPGGPPNIATMSTAQTTLQTSLGTLGGVVLKEIDQLLTDREDTLDYRRAEALGAVALALLVAVGALLLPRLGRRREPAPPAPDEPVPHVTAGPGQYDLPPSYGGNLDPTWRERSGALR